MSERTLAEIDADLVLFRALRAKAATTGIAEYSFDSGQGRQTVKRITLAEIRTIIRDLEAERLDVETGSAPVCIVLDRGIR